MKQKAIRKALALLLIACWFALSLPAYAAESSATVYFTLSSDGTPVMGIDGTVLSRVRVKVPYFDLALYDLENFYRYETEGNFGPYISDKLVERPTVLHLYIYMLERYYAGLDEEDCGKGYLDMDLSLESYDREGNVIFDDPQSALCITGSSTSMYMYNFWGHDENLMYFVDHQYPLMSPGWGATADYILLEDGMAIDVAMFTNWNFYTYGSFMYFEKDNYRFAADETQTISVFKSNTGGSVNGEYEKGLPAEGAVVRVWDEEMTECLDEIGVTDEYGQVEYCFEELGAGTYQISAEDPNQGTKEAAHAPAVASVKVTDEKVALKGISFEQETYKMNFGNTWQLAPVFEPEDATGVTCTWKSSDPDVVSVTEIGVLYAKKSGEATITCTATDGTNSFTAQCTVTVDEEISVEGIALDDDKVTMRVGETVKLGYTITPEDASNQSLLWRTSECPDFDHIYTDADHTTAKVDHLGNVTAKKAGTVTVMVKTMDGDFTDECVIEVVGETTLPDLSGDGEVTANDAVLLLQVAAGGFTIEDDALKQAADLTGDGKLDANDAVLLLQTIAAAN